MPPAACTTRPSGQNRNCWHPPHQPTPTRCNFPPLPELPNQSKQKDQGFDCKIICSYTACCLWWRELHLSVCYAALGFAKLCVTTCTKILTNWQCTQTVSSLKGRRLLNDDSLQDVVQALNSQVEAGKQAASEARKAAGKAADSFLSKLTGNPAAAAPITSIKEVQYPSLHSPTAHLSAP